MQELNRILNGDDVAGTALVDPVDDAGQGGAFSAASRAGHQHHAAAQLGQAGDQGRNAHLIRIRQTKGHHAVGRSQAAALPVGIAAKAAQVFQGKGEIVVSFLQQFVHASAPGQLIGLPDQLFRLIACDAIRAHRLHLPPHLDLHLGTGHNKNIRSAKRQGLLQDFH